MALYRPPFDEKKSRQIKENKPADQPSSHRSPLNCTAHSHSSRSIKKKAEEEEKKRKTCVFRDLIYYYYIIYTSEDFILTYIVRTLHNMELPYVRDFDLFWFNHIYKKNCTTFFGDNILGKANFLYKLSITHISTKLFV